MEQQVQTNPTIVQQTAQQPVAGQVQPGLEKKSKWWLWLIIAVAVILVGVGIYFLVIK